MTVTRAGASPTVIAQTVWRLTRSGNQPVGSFGEFIDAAISSRLAAAVFAPELDSRLGIKDADVIGRYPAIVLSKPGVADGFSAWGELVANVGTSPIVINYITVSMAIAAGESFTFEVEIGTGAAGAEVRAFSVVDFVNAPGTTPVLPIFIFPVFRRIPAGARLAARARDSSAATRNYYVSVGYRPGA
jgi:hypothetical protein